jgi:hypothetical protein
MSDSCRLRVGLWLASFLEKGTQILKISLQSIVAIASVFFINSLLQSIILNVPPTYVRKVPSKMFLLQALRVLHTLKMAVTLSHWPQSPTRTPDWEPCQWTFLKVRLSD